MPLFKVVRPGADNFEGTQGESVNLGRNKNKHIPAAKTATLQLASRIVLKLWLGIGVASRSCSLPNRELGLAARSLVRLRGMGPSLARIILRYKKNKLRHQSWAMRKTVSNTKNRASPAKIQDSVTMMRAMA